jgi:hypothetical protein
VVAPFPRPFDSRKQRVASCDPATLFEPAWAHIIALLLFVFRAMGGVLATRVRDALKKKQVRLEIPAH